MLSDERHAGLRGMSEEDRELIAGALQAAKLLALMAHEWDVYDLELGGEAATMADLVELFESAQAILAAAQEDAEQ